MESGTRILQPDSDSSARWQPRVLSSLAARGRDAIPPVPAIRLSPDPPGELHAARGYSVLSVARIPAPAARPRTRRPRRASGRSPHVTSPILRDPGNSRFVVELEKFSGPLDLLLHLIKEDEVDITDLPIAKIAVQFLSVINELGLNQAADYLEMAARLLRIKAQMLLPRRLGDDEWEDPRAELVRRVLEYQQIRELVEWLGAAAARRAEQFGRGFSPEPPVAPPAPLAKLVEAALFASARPLTVEELVTLDPQSGAAAVRGALAELRDAFATSDHGVELVEIAQGWQVLTRREYAEAIDRAQFALRPRRLSPAALETLAIIAYRQPVGRVEVDEIRGVDSGAVIEKLSERGLVEVVTRGEGLGRPLLYGTTPQFLEILGLKDLDELPRLDELSVALRPPAPAE